MTQHFGMLPSGTPSVVTAAIFAVYADAFGVSAYFTELGGIRSDIETADYFTANSHQGGQLGLMKQFGRAKPPTIQLKRGVDGEGEMWFWHKLAAMGCDLAKTFASIVMMDASGEVRAVFELECCWPTTVEISSAKAGSGDVVYESVTLICDSITYLPSGI